MPGGGTGRRVWRPPACDIIEIEQGRRLRRLVTMGHATYVYCILRSARRPGTARIPPGVPGAGPAAIEKLADGLWVVASTVPLDQYGPDVLDASLRDLDWVARLALGHEGVVEHFAQSRGITVIPMKLLTMFSTLAAGVSALRRRRRDLDRVLERIDGCEEWGVRVTRSNPRVTRGGVAKPRSGAAFLAARKQVRDDAVQAGRAAGEAAEAAFVSLAEVARHQTRISGVRIDDAATLLDAAFLVPVGRRARFQAVAERLVRKVARSGARMTITGPWPPYNFVGVEDVA